jgi:hypothetical protein
VGLLPTGKRSPHDGRHSSSRWHLPGEALIEFEVRCRLRAGKTGGEHAAFEVTAELPLHMRGHRFGVEVPIAGEREIGLEVALDDAVEQRALGATPAVDSAADLTCLRAVHGPVTSGW